MLDGKDAYLCRMTVDNMAHGVRIVDLIMVKFSSHRKQDLK